MAAGNDASQPWIALAVNVHGFLSTKLTVFFTAFRQSAVKKGGNLEHKPVLTLTAESEADAVAQVDDALRGDHAVQAKFLLVVDGIRNSQLRSELIRNFGKRLRVFTVPAGVASAFFSGRAGADEQMEQLTNRFCSFTVDGAGGKTRPLGNENGVAGEATTFANGIQKQQVTLFPMGIKTIDALCAKLDSKEIAKGSSELLRQLQGDSFIRRLNDPWPHIEGHNKLLRVIVAAASSTQADTSQMTHDLLLQVLDSNIVKETTEKHIGPMMWEEKKKNSAGAELVESFIKLLQLVFEQLPSKATQLLIYAQSTISVLRSESVCTGRWWSDSLTAKVDRLEAQLKSFIKQKQDASSAATAKGPREKAFGPPPENFRSLSIVPDKEDMVAVGDPYLRPIKTKGRYEDSEHYLDVQFRLLREDFVRPLRDGIRQYHNGGAGSRQAHLFLYRDVRIDAPQLHKMSGEMLCAARFKPLKRARWHKRLMMGSLVCLSYDDFRDNFIFAVVTDRDVEKLAKGQVGLFFENPAQIVHDANYRMVESNAYFEAYQHVLRSLQNINEDEPVPFATYLVEANTIPELPSYLRPDSSIDFASILAENKPTPSQNVGERSSTPASRKLTTQTPHKMVDVQLMQERLTPAELGLDESQFKALHMALSSELAVIQGPPGTGKTYVGHQVARVLLANENLWNPDRMHPMLVVCYTNHALDQFLEGIADFVGGGPNPIIRVGGRCRNENMKQFILYQVRMANSSGLPKDLRARNYQARDEQRRLCEGMERDGKIIAGLETKIVKLDQLLECIAPQHSQQFMPQGKFAKARPADIFMDWLTLVGSVANGTLQQAAIGHKMNASLVRNLMKNGMPEFAAKNATYLTGNQSDYKAVTWFFQNAMDPHVNEPIREVRGWPPMAAVDQLVEMDFADDVAVDALMAQGLNVQRALDHLYRQFGREHLQEEALPAEQVEAPPGMDDAELYDDERNDYFEEDDIVQPFKGTVDVDDMFERAGGEWTMVGSQDDRRERTNRYRTHILAAMQMKEEEAGQVRDIWALPLHRRWSLYQYWVAKLRHQYMRSLHENEKLYGAATKRVKEIRGMADVDLLRSARVIGMTTTGAAKHQATLRAIQPRIVIMEEAAEVLEAHLVTSLTEGCQHAILIGDHKQLRPNPAVYELAKKFGLDISLFERLINNNFPYATLAKQHRMRPEIARSLMPHFYDDLQDDESVYKYPHVHGVANDIVFINHSVPERTDNEIKSHSNQFEAEFAVRLARYLLQQNYQPQQVTVLCAYMDQMLQTRKLAVEVMGAQHGVRIEVVDNYQGEESDIIILSLVRSNNPDGKIGFLSVPNRVCVALSRAKMGLFCLANIDFLAEHSDLWREIRQSLDKIDAVQNALSVKCVVHGFEQKIATAKEFDSKCPEGGCRKPCNGRLECGHMCSKPCHAYDPQHESVVCTKPCTRTCPSPFKHPCNKRCDQECDDCRVAVVKELPCGHKTEAACHLKLDEVVCKVPCKNVLSCGHTCAARCNQPCTTSCQKIVRRPLSCGHQMDMRCFEDPATVACTTLVSKEWPNCKHKVDVPCSTKVDNTSCAQPCNTPLPGCGHLCKGTCGACRQSRLHVRCKEKCSRILVCGHECGSDCSKSCPPCAQPCETACTHSRCGRTGGEKGIKLRGSMVTEGGEKSKKGRKEKGRLCGDPCPPCAEECPNSCGHRKCELLCFQPCSVPPCTEPCKKPLKCGTEEEPHMCIGVCGEPCPTVCRICTPDEYAQAREIFFGDEDEEDARFIRLVDCGHLLEVKGMDEYVRRKVEPDNDTEGLPPGTEKTEIVTIDCPRCKTTIRRSLRYSSTLNKRAIDIEKIKLLVRGESKDNLDLRRNEILEQLTTFISFLKEGKRLGPSKTPKVITSASAIKNSIGRPDKKDLTVQSLTMWRNFIKLLGLLSKLYAEDIDGDCQIEPSISGSLPILRRLTTEFLASGPKRYLIGEWDYLLDRLTQQFDSMSDGMLEQFASEVQRLSLLTEAMKWVSEMARNRRDANGGAEQLLSDVLEILNGNRDVKDEVEEKVRKLIEELIQKHSSTGLILTKHERMQIIRALGSQVSKWYKCSKGHYYGIGECGQAMQRAKCPECDEDIGGESHRLVDSSQEAPEVLMQ